MGVTFISYMAAAFAVLMGIALILLLISKKNTEKTRAYWELVGFTITILAICLLYLFFYFRDMVLQIYEIGLPLRIVDYALYGSLLMCWLRVLGRLTESHAAGKSVSGILTWSWIVGIVRAGAGILATVFFMDQYYCFKSHETGTVFTAIEAAMVLGTAIIIIKYTMDFVKASVNRNAKNYAIFECLIIVFWEIQQVYVDAKLYLGIYISAWASGEVDTTAPAVFLLGLATFIFMFREDFSPMFYAKPVQPGEEGNLDPVEQTAIQHGLTTREVEVLRLMYEGKNNPEIADALFISRNTVKKHVQSIFEKTGVNSRMELSYLINQKEKQ